jgi:hypothetical protein
MRLALLFFFAVWSAAAQTNPVASANPSQMISNSPAEIFRTGTNQEFLTAQRFEKVRMDCIHARRIVCGKIVKVLPDGLVVDSGYLDLLRPPLNSSWLVPGTAVTARPANLVEASQPDAVCIGLVFLSDLPKTPGVKPALYDYVNLEGFPAGQRIYASVGDLRRTVRKFSTKIEKAVSWRLAQDEKQNAPPQ